MSIDSRLRRAADDAREKVSGLNPPPIRRHRRRVVFGWAFAGLAVVLLAVFLAPLLPTNPAADDGPTGTSTDTLDSEDVIPEVSKEEYDAAFEEFRSCVSDRGGELLFISETEFGTYDYSYADEDLAIHDDCYFALFHDAQIGYESHNEALLEADAEQNRTDWEENILPCLQANGFEVPGDFEIARSEVEADDLRVLHMVYTINLRPRGTCENTAGDTAPNVEGLRAVEMADSGLVVSFPADWDLAEESLTPNLGNPQEVFSLGSFPLTPGGPSCAQVPSQALNDMEATDVFLTVQERLSDDAIPGGFNPRPDNFDPTPGSTDNVFYDCLGPTDRSDVSAIHWIRFRDFGRYFHVLVAIGQDADLEDVSAIWDTLDRLVILPTN